MSSPTTTTIAECCGIPFPLRITALAALVFQTTSAVILTRYSKLVIDPSQPQYYSPTLVVMAELSKLILSMLFVFLFDFDPAAAKASTEASGSEGADSPDSAPSGSVKGDQGGGTSHFLSTIGSRWAFFSGSMYKENFANPLSTLKLAVPALLYTLQNNLIYVALANLEATTFQVGYQSKVITTAVLSVLMLSRRLSAQKWIALISLTLGIIMTQAEGGKRDSSSFDNANDEQNFLIGIVSVFVCAFCSAFAGVYFEKILKGSNPSVWIRNTQLAFFSTIIGLFGVFSGPQGFSINFFQGYTTIVWVIIFVQAFGGLIIAVVVKYADNILKGFATALSIVLCGMCSAVLFGFTPTLTFVIGSITVIGATFLYSAPDPPPAQQHQPQLPQLPPQQDQQQV